MTRHELTGLSLIAAGDGRILDITDRGAELCGYESREDALGQFAYECIDARTRKRKGALVAMHQRALAGTPSEGTEWRITREGWHYMAWRYQQQSKRPERFLYEIYLLTETLPYRHWVHSLVLNRKKPYLPLDPYIPNEKLDAKDIAILRGLLLGQKTPQIAKQQLMSIGTVNARKGRILSVLKPYPLDAHCCGIPQIALNALGLDRFILDNPHWLTYPLKV